MLGAQNPILILESLIVVLLKLIVTKDRNNVITREIIHSQLKLHYILERNMMRKNIDKHKKRWEKLSEHLLLEHV